MELNLSKETVGEIYKDIRSSKQYMKHAQLQKEYMKQGQYAKAALEGKIMKEMEVAVFAEVAKHYIDRTQYSMELVASMAEEDKHNMNILTNGIVMLADVLDVLVMDVNSVLGKYKVGKCTEFDKLKGVLGEVKGIVSYFDKVLDDKYAQDLFGDMSDNLYKMIFNKASSYVNKLKKHEESINKKAARHAKVA